MIRTVTVVIAGALASGPSYALDQWVCNAEDVLRGRTQGVATVIENPLQVTSQFPDVETRIDFGFGTVCGVEPSVKTACRTVNRSSTEAVQVDLVCDVMSDTGEAVWLAKGGLTIRRLTGLGRFECRSRHGVAESVILNFSNCRFSR